MNSPRYIFVHHTGVSYNKNPDQAEATNRYHKKKWNFKSSTGYYGGYNAEASKEGKITTFRPDGENTAAQYQKRMNDGRALSICMDGAFHLPDEEPTLEQARAVLDWINEKMELHSIPKENIFPHRHIATKASGCPGWNIPDDVYSYLQELVEKKPPIIPEWSVEHVEKAKKHGIDQWDDPEEVVGGATLEYVLEDLGLLDREKHEGQVTKLELIVALSRAGLLD